MALIDQLKITKEKRLKNVSKKTKKFSVGHNHSYEHYANNETTQPVNNSDDDPYGDHDGWMKPHSDNPIRAVSNPSAIDKRDWSQKHPGYTNYADLF